VKKILIADDEKEIRELLAQKLRNAGYDTATAADGNEVLVRCREEAFDLLLLDVAMPGLDGYQACRQLRDDDKTGQIPVLFLTGKDLDPKSLTKRLNELNASGYIQKPSPFSELLDKVKETIG
jgi:CheY-like chemotaxis protein